MNKEKKVISVEEATAQLMDILGGKPMKVTQVGSMENPIGTSTAAPKEVTYEGGHVVAIDGVKTATGPKKRTGARVAKVDPVKDMLKELYIRVIKRDKNLGKDTFSHTTEGFVIRMEEADYAVKVSKSKEAKNDPAASDFEVVKDFTVRGKAKNSAPAIAKAVLAEIESSDEAVGMILISAKASGIILHTDKGEEYTIKISKKRERVGFQAESAAAYE